MNRGVSLLTIPAAPEDHSGQYRPRLTPHRDTGRGRPQSTAAVAPDTENTETITTTLVLGTTIVNPLIGLIRVEITMDTIATATDEAADEGLRTTTVGAVEEATTEDLDPTSTIVTAKKTSFPTIWSTSNPKTIPCPRGHFLLETWN